jgi:hypothetical protein
MPHPSRSSACGHGESGSRDSRTRIICQQIAQRLARQHRLINSRDLVRERIYERSVDCQYRVEKMRQPDAIRLRNEPKESAIPVKAPRSSRLNQLDA